MADDFKFEITEQIGVISEGAKGWNTELNMVSWNERTPKYDIRAWDSEHKKMGKGVSFTAEELKKLKEILNEMDL